MNCNQQSFSRCTDTPLFQSSNHPTIHSSNITVTPIPRYPDTPILYLFHPAIQSSILPSLQSSFHPFFLLYRPAPALSSSSIVYCLLFLSYYNNTCLFFNLTLFCEIKNIFFISIKKDSVKSEWSDNKCLTFSVTTQLCHEK